MMRREDLRQQVIEVAGHGKVRLDASFGVACANELGGDDTAVGLLERADQALYATKRAKRSPSAGRGTAAAR